jgi:Second Messenger Oligonucleotide or Dinucleotide Synthetase domain
MNQGAAFQAFDEHLNLDPAQRQRAERLHAEMTEFLISEGLIVGGFLQGSFARKTMRAPLHDVDKVVLLPVSQEAAIRAQLRGPDAVMDSLERAIDRRYHGTTFERKKHVLQSTLPGYDFPLDIAPAFEGPADGVGDVFIANREAVDPAEAWERSNTRALMRVVSARNAVTLGRFIHWVRMGKEMAAQWIGPELAGMQTESLCYAANTKPTDDATACQRLFDVATRLLSGDYFDPTGVQVISRRLAPDLKARALEAFRQCADQAQEARALAAAGDDDNACVIWHSIFGDAFPVPVGQTVQDAFAKSYAGAASITSAGLVSHTPAARQPSRGSRAWAP